MIRESDEKRAIKSSCELKQIINQYFDHNNKISIIEKYGEISNCDVSKVIILTPKVQI